jgi:phage baseplate assembly protein W
MTSGIGFKFDPLDTENTDPRTAAYIKEDARLVAESIHRIINTRLGERPGNPEFGCRVHELMFEPDDFLTATIGSFYVSDAIELFEPRAIIEYINPIVEPDQNTLAIEVVFRLANNPQNAFRTISQVIPNG